MLRRRDAGESDRRLTVLSREHGKLDVVAKGARKGGSRLAGSSEPLVAVVLQVAVGKVNRFVTQAQPSSSFPGLRADYDRLAMALAMAELFEAVIPWEEGDPGAYELLLRVLQALERHEKPAVALVWAQVALLREAGFQPSFARCASNGSALVSGKPWFSPQAGGLVSDGQAHEYQDAFQTRAEALMGLDRIAELDAPPGNLKFVEECLRVLLATWRHVLERPLPAATQAYEATL
ncbi:MAG: DNA repair protein RecO [Fimbriimonadaceae bacterium]|nr:DNA repair protein RecO [Chthonomonadaceae bacterium]MCO5297142.1 DNA repair protein RecO [Fimbriimonadaceae bacterium]